MRETIRRIRKRKTWVDPTSWDSDALRTPATAYAPTLAASETKILMKIFLLKILILTSLNCYSQYLVKLKIDKDIFSRNETIKIDYVLESDQYINLQFAVIKSNDKGEHKFDTIEAKSIQTIRTTSLVDSIVTNKGRFTATKKILPCHVGSFELPICELLFYILNLLR
jgi:hypothetical protein